jgi:predicted enzyme related to lactoylglutathione lyase
MNNKPKFGFILEYVMDIEAAKRFYIEVLNLEVEREHPVFVQFNHFAIASDESMSGNRDPEVYWLVDDAEAAFVDLSQKAEVIQSLKQMPFGKVFGIKDPAGQPLYLLEFAQHRPSQAVSEKSPNQDGTSSQDTD